MAEIAPRPYGPTPAWDDRSIDRDPAGYVRALIQEAHGFTEDDLQEKHWFRRWYENPGFLSAVPKTEREKLDDARQEYVLRHLQRVSPQLLHRFDDLMQGDAPFSDEQVGSLRRAYATYPIERGRLSSDYRTHGVEGALTPGSAGHAALEWAGSFPAMATAGAQLLADASDSGVSAAYGREPAPRYPDAYSDFFATGQTFLRPFGYQSPARSGEEVSYAKRRQDMSSAYDQLLPPDSWALRELLGDAESGLERSAMEMAVSQLPSQRELLVDAGVPSSLATAGDFVHSVVLDPFSSVGSAVKTARAARKIADPTRRAAKSLQALRELGEEGYLYGGLLMNEGIQSLGTADLDGMPQYYAPEVQPSVKKWKQN